MNPRETAQVQLAIDIFTKEMEEADKEKLLRLLCKITALEELDAGISLADNLATANTEMLKAKTVVLNINDKKSSDGMSAHKKYKRKKAVYNAILKATQQDVQEDVQQEPVVEAKDETTLPLADATPVDQVVLTAEQIEAQKKHKELSDMVSNNQQKKNGENAKLKRRKQKLTETPWYLLLERMQLEKEIDEFKKSAGKYTAEIKLLNEQKKKLAPLLP